MSRKIVSAIDLFCGAGGLSLGLQQSGIEISAGVDLDPSCRWPFETNIGAPFIEASVRDVSGNDLRKLWNPAADARVLAGCAPCQPFSSQRRGASTKSEEAWDLLGEFGRLVEETLPEYVTMENVAPLKNSPVFDRFLLSLVNSGYNVTYKVLHGEKHGLPQTRRRLILVAALKHRLKLPDHSVSDEKRATVEAFIGSLPPLRSGEADSEDRLHVARNLTEINQRRLAHSKPGGTWRDWPEDLRAPCHQRASGSSFGAFYGRMSWDLPAPTITTQFHNYGSGRFGHPVQDRTITPREAALLQGFPRDFQFVPPDHPVRFTTVGKMIGNAVPPPFGRVVGSVIRESVCD